MEASHNDGPWDYADDYRRLNGVLRYARHDGGARWNVTAMGYYGLWNATDQIPRRAVTSGEIDRFGAIDPTDGGKSYRFSLSGGYRWDTGAGTFQADVYAVRYRLNLFSNFTYFLDDPVNGDQFEQMDDRWMLGTSGSYVWTLNALDLTVGWEARHDRIDPIGLYHTASRERLAAVRQDSALDYAMRVFSLAGLSMPSFWLGMVIILTLVSWLGWIPPLTYVRPTENFWLHSVQFLLPALAVGYRSSALIMRITRSAMLEVLREDYIRTAWAKGQNERAVVWRHALKNAILPVVTVIGIEFAFLIGGLVVTVFNLPGVARFLVEAILWRDYPIVQNLVMFIAIVVILSNLAVDLLYGVLDPRVRYAG